MDAHLESLQLLVNNSHSGLLQELQGGLCAEWKMDGMAGRTPWQ